MKVDSIDDSLNAVACWHVESLCSMMLYSVIGLDFDMILMCEIE